MTWHPSAPSGRRVIRAVMMYCWKTRPVVDLTGSLPSVYADTPCRLRTKRFLLFDAEDGVIPGMSSCRAAADQTWVSIVVCAVSNQWIPKPSEYLQRTAKRYKMTMDPSSSSPPSLYARCWSSRNDAPRSSSSSAESSRNLLDVRRRVVVPSQTPMLGLVVSLG